MGAYYYQVELAVRTKDRFASFSIPMFYVQAQPGPNGERDPVAYVLLLKLKAQILDMIHSIEVVRLLQENNVKTTADWLWKKQLRFYLQNGSSISKDWKMRGRGRRNMALEMAC